LCRFRESCRLLKGNAFSFYLFYAFGLEHRQNKVTEKVEEDLKHKLTKKKAETEEEKLVKSVFTRFRIHYKNYFGGHKH